MPQSPICTTVELFCGIGGFRIAADQRNIATIWANDRCPKACQVYRDRFGDTSLYLGDIYQLVDQIPPHDLLTAGFPCQPFSSAGKKREYEIHAVIFFKSLLMSCKTTSLSFLS